MENTPQLTVEQKKQISDEIHQKIKEFNDLLKKSKESGLVVIWNASGCIEQGQRDFQAIVYELIKY
jgi:uncharacterized protein YjgD (DUF1641 family)